MPDYTIFLNLPFQNFRWHNLVWLFSFMIIPFFLYYLSEKKSQEGLEYRIDLTVRLEQPSLRTPAILEAPNWLGTTAAALSKKLLMSFQQVISLLLMIYSSFLPVRYFQG